MLEWDCMGHRLQSSFNASVMNARKEGSDTTTRIFGYIQYISRNDKYPICILWVLTTMTTLVNRGVLVTCDIKATGRLHIDRVELLDVAPSHVQYRDHVIDHNTHLKVSPRYDINRTQIRYDIDIARTLSRYKSWFT